LPNISLSFHFGGDTVATQIRIGKRAVDGLSPRSKPYIVFDETIKGFGVRVAPNGEKTLVLEYRPGGGGRGVAKKRLRLGRYGEMTADQARAAALDALAQIRLGHDPQAEKVRQRASLTVGGLIDAFLEGHAAKRKSSTAENYQISLEHLRSAHGAVKAEALTRQQIAALHTRLSATPYAANRMLATVSSAWAWAEDHGLVPEGSVNPAKKVTRYPEQGRERFLTGDELARLGDALRTGETNGLPYCVDETKPNAKHAPKAENRLVKLDPFAVAAIRLLILTGARLREILNGQWSQLDLDRGILFLADSKTGRKPIYLSAAAQAVLALIPRLDGNPYIIAGAREGAPRADLKTPWAAVTRAAGLEGLRIHDLRHSFASVGAGASLGLPLIGKLLGHTTATTTQRYAHLDSDPLRRAAETIGSALNGAMNREPGAEVVRLGKR
jgi:integrase